MIDATIDQYFSMLLRADVKIEDYPVRNLRFNDASHAGEYHRQLWQAECDMLPHLQTLASKCLSDKRFYNLLRDQCKEYEQILDIAHSAKGKHRYLTITHHEQKKKISALTRSEQQTLAQYLTIQQTSFLRYRNFLLNTQPPIKSDYRIQCHATEWLELGDALFQSGLIIPEGSNQSEENFIQYFFEIFNSPLPSNYKRQLTQIRERSNPTRFLEKLCKNYLDKLSDMLQQGFRK